MCISHLSEVGWLRFWTWKSRRKQEMAPFQNKQSFKKFSKCPALPEESRQNYPFCFEKSPHYYWIIICHSGPTSKWLRKLREVNTVLIYNQFSEELWEISHTRWMLHIHQTWYNWNGWFLSRRKIGILWKIWFNPRWKKCLQTN